MLKKAGIVVAAAATGLFALSPLAFADEDITYKVDQSRSVEQSNDCEFDQDARAVNVGAVAAPGVLPAIAGQEQTGSCVNSADVDDDEDEDETGATPEDVAITGILAGLLG
jgi:hypothetical protein